LACINELDQGLARLVLGWVTVCRRVNHPGMLAVAYIMQPAGQLSLAIPPWVGAMSTAKAGT